MQHDLKIWPAYFRCIVDGTKTFELRDENPEKPFATGDALILREWNPDLKIYTGQSVGVLVTYKLPGGTWSLREGVVILGIQITPAIAVAGPISELRRAAWSLHDLYCGWRFRQIDPPGVTVLDMAADDLMKKLLPFGGRP